MSDSQKFIARNRAPRVQIEYDVELYGAQKKVQLPFVMGVLSDLSGKAERPAVADRKFLEIDSDNFDERMRAMAPRAQFTVPDTLTGEGALAVDLTFEKLDDFSPGAIAARVEALAPLLEARRALDDLLAYMDGKSGAEALIEQVLGSPSLLHALAGQQGESGNLAADLEALKASLPDPPEAEETDTQAAALEALRRAEVPRSAPVDDRDSVLAGLADATEPEDQAGESVDDILAGIEPRTDDAPAGRTDDILAATVTDLPHEDAADTHAAALDGVRSASPVAQNVDKEDRESILASLEPVEPDEKAGAQDAADDLDALLSGLDDAEGEMSDADPDPDADRGGGVAAPAVGTDGEGGPAGARDAADDLDALLSGLGGDEDERSDADPDPDDLMADLAPDSREVAQGEPAGEQDATDDLDALLSGLDDAEDETSDADPEPDAELDDLMAGLDLDDGEEGDEEPVEAKAAVDATGQAGGTPAPQSPFGTISAPRPDRESLNRNRFRIALLGDFSGRAARGLREVGADLAARPPILLDVDTVEEVIEGFATTLTLPIGKDGDGIEVKLGEFDDLHPDELYDNVEIFEALAGLRQQLSMGSMAERATAQLKEWSETWGAPVRLPKRSAATSVPPNLKLSDFQALIGDTGGALRQASPAEDLIARIVGPHVLKAPDAGAEAMKQAVDEALSSAMRLVLHHPDFQAVEAQWRALDLMARRIETDTSLEIVLYDISAEELAMDLAAQEDLGESGFFQLLTDVFDPEEGAGGFSAILGLYTFEETPPHAELLARIGQVAAHVDAPFVAAITPAYLETDKADRHPLVAAAWDRLRALPAASYLGLASPRFLLRRPYGAKSEPCSAFGFEEFTPQEGLAGMLWANPVVLVGILLAATWKKDGKAMDLGSLMSLGDMPFHYVEDRYGDQVALPCTERNLTADPVQHTLARGYMPVLSIKGRNEIRLGAFRALSGEMIAGPWSGAVPAASPTPPAPTLETQIAAGPDAADTDAGPQSDDDLDGLLAGLDAGDDAGGSADTGASGDDDDLDALLAGFDEDPGDDDTDEEMDPELAALLEGL